LRFLIDNALPPLLAARDRMGTLIPALPLPQQDLDSGCVAVFRKGRLQVRRLPFSA
jgi:hypothetical protein